MKAEWTIFLIAFCVCVSQAQNITDGKKERLVVIRHDISTLGPNYTLPDLKLKYGGTLNAYTKTVNTLEGDTWPGDKAIAVLYFGHDINALQWFHESKNEFPLKDADVIMHNLTHPFNTVDQGFMLSLFDITNETAFYEVYMPLSGPAFGKFQGKGVVTSVTDAQNYVILQNNNTIWPSVGMHVLFHTFPDTTEAKALYDSVDYQPSRELRQTISTGNVYTFERFSNPGGPTKSPDLDRPIIGAASATLNIVLFVAAICITLLSI